MSSSNWIAEQVLEYLRQRQEEERFLLELGNDHSLENIQRVVRKQIYGEQNESNTISNQG